MSSHMCSDCGERVDEDYMFVDKWDKYNCPYCNNADAQTGEQ